MFIGCALHGVEASLLLCVRFGPGGNLWVVLVLFWAFLMGLTVVPSFCLVWFKFGLFRRYLSVKPEEVPGVYRLLEMVQEGCPGHGPVHALVASARRIGFRLDPAMPGWERQVFLACVIWLVPFSISGLRNFGLERQGFC